MVGTWPKPATSKLSLLVRSVKGTGSAAARAAAAGEAGEPSDGGRSCIGASAVGAVGGGIHRCGSLRGAGRRLWTDRSSAGGVQVGRPTLKERRRRHERLIRVDFWVLLDRTSDGFARRATSRAGCGVREEVERRKE